MVENGLAHAHRLRCHFHQLIGLDVLQAFLQAHDDLRHDASLVVGTRSTHVGELLGLADVDDKVVVVHMFADDQQVVAVDARILIER